MQNLTIGLSAWIIQDGNYRDFTVGDEAAFALEFYSESGLLQTAGKAVGLQWQGDSFYDGAGRVVHLDTDWWVLDFGVLAYSESRPPTGAEVGQMWSGGLSIGVDPFFYFEHLARRPSAPAIIYDWIVENIEAGAAIDRKALSDAPISRRPIRQTDAWTDGTGDNEYLLHCRRLTDGPTRRSRGA